MGVLNDYPNAAAVNDALNKGVEANKVVGELKSDLDILNQGGLNLKEDFIGQQVNGWLDEHPEATTTVQDASLEVSKFTENTKKYIVKDYVTPQMFGAKGDGKTDDSNAIQEAVNNGTNVFIPSGTYLINNTINIEKDVTIVGVKDRAVLKTVDKTIFNIVSGGVNFENIRFESNTVTYKQATNTDGVFPFDYYQFTYTNETSVAVYSASSSPCKFFNCKFIKLYKGASTLNNSELHDCRFSHCIVAYECRSFDPFFWNCYFTCCKQGIIMSNTSYNAMFVYNCWFDQIGEHAIGTKDTSVGGYINATFDQIGGSAICARTLSRLNILGRFSRCGAKYAVAESSVKDFYNGEHSAVIHAENAANMLNIHACFPTSIIKGDSIKCDPLILSVRTGHGMVLSGWMEGTKIYSGVNPDNTGTVINGYGFYKINGINLVEIGVSN